MESTSQPESRESQFPIGADVNSLPDESTKRRAPFSVYDIFFWRDAPDWYNKTFLSAGFGLCILTMRQYLSKHEIEVFLPPRARILPKEMQEGYAQTQRFKHGLFKVGKETTWVAGTGAVFYGGAYYLGLYRGLHDWTNFAASGALAGTCMSLFMIRPFLLRTTVFGSGLGAMLGSASGYAIQASGLPFWDESHGFEGWWLGEYINTKNQDTKK